MQQAIDLFALLILWKIKHYFHLLALMHVYVYNTCIVHMINKINALFGFLHHIEMGSKYAWQLKSLDSDKTSALSLASAISMLCMLK